MSGTIKGLEIFAAGTWNSSNAGRITFTEADIQELVDNFAALQNTNIVKPHLKLGHQETQKWFGQKTGVPTLGWIERVWRDGKKLMADISNVPESLLDMFRQRRYHNVSAEIYPPGTVEFNGKKLGHVLSAVAVLGTEMPAVKDLAGLAGALFANEFTDTLEAQPNHFVQEPKGMTTFTQDQLDALVAAAVGKAVSETTTKFTGDLASSAAQIKVLSSRAEAAEKEVAKIQADFATKEIDGLIEDAIKDGRMLPAQKDVAKAFMASMGDKVVTFGGKEKTPVQLFGDFLGLMGKQVKLQEGGSGKNGAGGGSFSSPSQEVDVKTREYMRENAKINYADAMQAVLSGDAELRARYAEGVV